MKKQISALILALLASPAAAAPAREKAAAPAPKTAAAPAAKQGGPGLCIFGGQSGKPFDSEAAFNSVLWKSDVVYVGETHDEPLDHQAQLAALKAMRIARGSRIIVGFEMLNAALQPALDDYASGKIAEGEFLARVDWEKEWKFDFAMYRPLFDFVIANKLKAAALNVPRPVIMKIARVGLDALTSDEKKFLPEKVTVSEHKKYTEYLKKSFSEHGSTVSAKSIEFENYSAAMAAWNEGMGAKLAEHLAANPGYAALVVAGNGHIAYNAAIPASVKARVPGLRQASFYIENAPRCPEKIGKDEKDLANYVWYIAHPARPKPAAPPAASTAAPAALPVSSAAVAELPRPSVLAPAGQ